MCAVVMVMVMVTMVMLLLPLSLDDANCAAPNAQMQE